jgi:hypothetical protein
MIDRSGKTPSSLPGAARGPDVFTATAAEIRRAGLAAVAQALGPVGLARFLQLYEGGSGDYTAERDAVVGTPTVDELLEALDREGPHTT